MRIKLKVEPIAKGRARNRIINGHAWSYTPSKTKKAQDELRALFIEALAHAGLGMYPALVPVKLSVTFYRTKAKWLKRKESLPYRKPDLDNFLKLLLDALNGVAFADDAQITSMVVKKRWTPQTCSLRRGKDRPNGHGYITIAIMEDTGG